MTADNYQFIEKITQVFSRAKALTLVALMADLQEHKEETIHDYLDVLLEVFEDGKKLCFDFQEQNTQHLAEKSNVVAMVE